jgi:hypothetical protein
MASETRVQFKDRVLVDNIYESAVDTYQAKARRRNFIILLVIAVAVIAGWTWLR